MCGDTNEVAFRDLGNHDIKVAGESDRERYSRERDQEALLARLRPVVSDLRVDPPSGERVALSAQLLVRRSARTELDGVIAHLGAALQGYLGLRYIGPLAPYSFTALRLEPEVSAQATESRER